MEHDGKDGSTRPRGAPCQTPCAAAEGAGCAAHRAALLGPERRAGRVGRAASAVEHPGPIAPQGFMAETTVEIAVLLTAQMFGLSIQTVTAIVQVGVPELCRLAESNPLLQARLYAASRTPLPEPIAQFYVRMATSPAVRQAIMDDHKATYGGMLDPVNRAAGRQAGTTDGQAREVLAALLPAICQVLGRAHAGGKTGFAQKLKELGETTP